MNLKKVITNATATNGVSSEEAELVKDRRWTDRERVLGLCSRGSLARTRHLLKDLQRLMPHIRHESKFDKGKKLNDLNEVAELSNCTKCMYLESRKHRDLYLWLSHVDGGPSVKFLVHNLHTMFELKFAGNCLKGSRPILSFDAKFDVHPHLKLVKELLIGVFKTPRNHPKSQPFIDHVLNFSITKDDNIWVRNYQIVNDSGKLDEIGPRMVWEIIRIFDGSFGGQVLFSNPTYKTPNAVRRELKLSKAIAFTQRQDQKVEAQEKEKFIRSVPIEDPVGELFDTAAAEEAKKASFAAREVERAILKKHRKAMPKEGRKKAKKARLMKKAASLSGDGGVDK